MFILFIVACTLSIIATVATLMDFLENFKTHKWLGRFPPGEARDMALETLLCVALWSLTIWSYNQ